MEKAHRTSKVKDALGSRHPFEKRSKPSEETKMDLYKLIIRPMITHVPSSWGYAAHTKTAGGTKPRSQINRVWHGIYAISRYREISKCLLQSYKTFASLEKRQNSIISSLRDDYGDDIQLKHKRLKVMLRLD